MIQKLFVTQKKWISPWTIYLSRFYGTLIFFKLLCISKFAIDSLTIQTKTQPQIPKIKIPNPKPKPSFFGGRYVWVKAEKISCTKTAGPKQWPDSRMRAYPFHSELDFKRGGYHEDCDRETAVQTPTKDASATYRYNRGNYGRERTSRQTTVLLGHSRVADGAVREELCRTQARAC